jgi:hypothetical protein
MLATALAQVPTGQVTESPRHLEKLPPDKPPPDKCFAIEVWCAETKVRGYQDVEGVEGGEVLVLTFDDGPKDKRARVFMRPQQFIDWVKGCNKVVEAVNRRKK